MNAQQVVKLNKDNIIKNWASFYKDNVEDSEYGEPDCVTDQAGYNLFGEFMYTSFLNEKFLYDKEEFTADDFGADGTEDRMFYRAYAITQGLNAGKLNSLAPMDEGPMAGYVLIWFKLNLVDINQVMSSLGSNFKNGRHHIRKVFNPKTKVWTSNTVTKAGKVIN